MSTPALSWNARLNMTKVEIELIPDFDRIIFSKKGMRGGGSYISNRYSKANNKYLNSYDSKQESKHIIYLEMNKEYGCAISKFISTNLFQRIDLKEFYLNKYTNNNSKRVCSRIDLKYQKDFRKLHNDYTLAPEKIEIKREMFSNYRLKIVYFYNIHIGNVKKLVPNFFDKEKYVLCYENLQLY